MQLGLFDAGAGTRRRAAEEGLWPQAGAAEQARPRQQIDLGDGAWLEVQRGFARGHQQLFDLLERSADWEQHEREMYERVVAVPRLVASCPGTPASRMGTAETVVRVTPHRAPKDDVARAARALHQYQATLSERYARGLSSISLALYRGGADSVAFHGDKLGPLRPDTVVAIVSLGAPRHFLLRRAPGRGATGRGEPLPPSLLSAGVGVLRSRTGRVPTFALAVGEGDLLVMGGNFQETWEHAVPKQPVASPRIAVMFRERWDEVEGAIRNVRGPTPPVKARNVMTSVAPSAEGRAS